MTHGMLTVDDLTALVDDGAVETVIVGFTDLYGRLCGKRFEARFFLDAVVVHGTHCCDYLLTTDIELDPVPGYRFASWEQGFGDMHLIPDLATLRTASWLDRSALVLCDVDGVDLAPRSILRRQVEAAAELGVQAMAATELEYYLFRTGYRSAHQGGWRDLDPVGWHREDYQLLPGTRTELFHAEVRRALGASGVPVESSKGEWGVGQHELNVRYTDALTMADRHVVYKQCLKDVADRHGLAATFMAKYDAAQAGSSCHVHMSLFRDGRNAFAGTEEVGPVRGSHELRWFVGGCLAHAAELMPWYTPTVNSYKRYVDGSWAPTRLAWSYDNRTAGLRVVGAGDDLRVECRIPGADCNPYLALAALLASGLDGIRRRCEPPPCFAGDAYGGADLAEIPRTLRDAVDLFTKSDFARSTFGDDVIDHHAHFFRTEQAAYDMAVTDWERARYFERI